MKKSNFTASTRDQNSGIAENLPNYVSLSEYLSPKVLRKTEKVLHKVLITGSCLSESWVQYFRDKTETEFNLINYVQDIPQALFENIENIDLHLISIPLRSVLPDSALFNFDISKNHALEQLAQAQKLLLEYLDKTTFLNRERGVFTLISNFLLPQFDSLGYLSQTNSPSDLRKFIQSLNETVENYCEERNFCFVLNIDLISQIIGRSYIQNDLGFQTNHGGILTNWGYEYDTSRIEAIQPISMYFESKSDEFAEHVYNLAESMYRSFQQIDAVKAVVVDLDGTLWRGVLADQDFVDQNLIEGWPLGIADALKILKNRGILLGIISKNDQSFIENIWQDLFGTRLKLSDFTSIRIGWESKEISMAEIIKDFSLLDSSVLYLDDNPFERDLIVKNFPGIRILEGNPYLWRYQMLKSAEMQPLIIPGSIIERNQSLSSLKAKAHSINDSALKNNNQLRVNIYKIETSADAALNRCLELINKTNQFNSTGMRWQSSEIISFLNNSGTIYYFDALDAFVPHGIVGVVLVQNQMIRQFVMSCRMIGRGIEIGVLHELFKCTEFDGNSKIEFRQTERNSIFDNFLKTFGKVLDSEKGIYQLQNLDKGINKTGISFELNLRDT